MPSFDISYFINAGKECGLEGRELRDWAEKQLHDHKENIRKERES